MGGYVEQCISLGLYTLRVEVSHIGRSDTRLGRSVVIIVTYRSKLDVAKDGDSFRPTLPGP